ncbi:MAG: class I SAM-dependent methyltransferase [Nitrospirota bacterium]
MQCPICNNPIGWERESLYLSQYNDQEYKLNHCTVCHIEFWYPLLMVQGFYEENKEGLYLDMHSGIRREPTADHRLFFRYFKEPKGRVLDVGCGDGVFLEKAGEWAEAYGIDLDAYSVAVAVERRGLKNVYRMNLEQFASFAGSKGLKFDVVTFFEVLEHQDNPRRFMGDIRSLLKEGGYIAGSVPNRERLFASVDRTPEFYGDLPPHHFLWFSADVLRSFLEREGFFKIEIYPVAEIENLIAVLEAWVIRNSGLWKLRDGLKRSTSNAKPSAVPCGLDSRSYKLLRMIRNLFFFLPAAALYPLFRKRKGYQLYFQAQLSR